MLRNEWSYVVGWYGAIVLWRCVMLCLCHCIIVHGWRFIIIIIGDIDDRWTLPSMDGGSSLPSCGDER